jgi:hypothetical protein
VKIFKRYLAERHGIPFSAQTPAEVGHALRDAKLPEQWAADAEQFLNDCDTLRFAPQPADTLRPNTQAAALIESWESSIA